MSDQPPGWYPLPKHQGHMRYWDGSQWTAEAGPDSAAGHAPHPQAVPQEAPTENARLPKRLGLLVAGVAALAVAVVAGVVVFVVGPSEPDPGAPFSPTLQTQLTGLANRMGFTLSITGETGSCEVLRDIYAHLPADAPFTSTREQTVAATSSTGSLYITIADATGSNDEALTAVQSCTEYLVGTRVGDPETS